MAEEKPRFDINPHVIRQLGAELVTDQTTALMELIKNSYDADADYVKVTINTKDTYPNLDLFYPNYKGYIIVEDSGFGMDRETVLKSWLTISYSNKRAISGVKPKTPKGRTPLGDKGLGRLSTQRLARICEIFTKKENQAAYHVGFNWDDFDYAERLGDVNVKFDETIIEKKSGTTLILLGLLDIGYWQGKNLEIFKSALCQLISPYDELRMSKDERVQKSSTKRPFNVYLTINDENVDLIQEMNNLNKLSITDTKFVFENGIMNVDFNIQMRKLIGTDFNTYSKIILQDGGKRFLEYFISSKYAKTTCLKPSNNEAWLNAHIEFKLEDLPLVSTLEDFNMANPGNFFGHIMEFSYNQEREDDKKWWKSLYEEFSSYKAFVQNQSGIRLYRNGFAVRPYGINNNDWLKLSESQTSGLSYYGFRPKNVIGYVAIDEEDNKNLRDKTDREGLLENEYYRNFYRLITEVIGRVNSEMEKLRRGYNDFRNSLNEDNTKIRSLQQAYNAITNQAEKGIKVSDSYNIVKNKLKNVQEKVDIVIKNSKGNLFNEENDNLYINTLNEVSSILQQSKVILDQAYDVLKDSNELSEALLIIKPKLDALNEKIVFFSELASLGLISEMVSHDIGIISGHMLGKSTELENYLKTNNEVTKKQVYGIIDFINSTVTSLKSQMKHLDSSMKYTREKIDSFKIGKMLQDEEIVFFKRKLMEDDIFISCEIEEEFDVNMNKGKLIQIMDNLINNSTYWLKAFKQQLSAPLEIKIRVSKPWIYIEDNGKGIDPSIEESLFEPFETRKPQGEGRGLGLFIIRQLLDNINCDIVLDQIRNKYNNRYRFSINLTSVLKK